MLLLHILLFLLKLIGIVLLIILGLILLILAVVLLTPIRYRVGASKYQAIQAEGKVTWLFHLVELLVHLDTGKEEGKRLHLSVRIAWAKLYDNQEPKKRRIKPKKSSQTKESQVKVSQTQESQVKVSQTQESQAQSRPKPEGVASKAEAVAQNEGVASKAEAVAQNEDGSSTWQKIGDLGQAVLRMIVSLVKGVWSILLSILRIPEKVMEKIEVVEAFFTRLREKKDAFLAFYYEEQNHRWFTAFWQRLKRLLLRIMPGIDKLYLHFGLDDPATTGQVLGGLSILYPLCGEKMVLCPEFDKEILEGEFKCHGQIRLIRVAAFAISSFLNRQFFAIVKQLKGLMKGE